jgi:glucosamine-6-phosphate deaminase
MSFKVIITRDFNHMSEVGANLAIENIQQVLAEKNTFTLGLATGNSPTGLYKHLARAANEGVIEGGKIQSFNLDEYVGLPGENAQQRALHPESYSFFMIQELFSLLKTKFKETNVPWGTLIDQEKLIRELEANPSDWKEEGTDKGKAVVINNDTKSDYLKWIRESILDAYEQKILRCGGIDLHIIGVGGRGHVAFHESGIPFKGNRMLLVKLDDSTIENAIRDGHFARRNESPSYAISMGAELVYKARTVILLASGSRKTEPIAESLLNDPTPLVPISYGRIYAESGGRMIYVIDRSAAEELLQHVDTIKGYGIEIEDLS